MEEEFITGVLHRYRCIIEKKILVMVPASRKTYIHASADDMVKKGRKKVFLEI